MESEAHDEVLTFTVDLYFLFLLYVVIKSHSSSVFVGILFLSDTTALCLTVAVVSIYARCSTVTDVGRK